jgi:hypothetical protein
MSPPRCGVEAIGTGAQLWRADYTAAAIRRLPSIPEFFPEVFEN